MEVDEKKLYSVIQGYFFGFYDCSDCPLCLDCPKINSRNSKCVDGIINWVKEERSIKMNIDYKNMSNEDLSK